MMPILGSGLLKHGGIAAPTAIEATGGTPQSASCGAPFAAQLEATITPPLSGVLVTFTAPSSGPSGLFASTGTATETVLTVAGVATSSTFTAGPIGQEGAYNVVASTGALSCTFALTNNWTWFAYITSLALPAWWRMRDTSGVTVVNSGSLGSALDLTATAWTMAQAGQLGAGEAGLADGATTKLTRANNAILAACDLWEFFALVKPSSAGEGSKGRFFSWGDGAVAGGDSTVYFNGAIDALQGYICNTAGGQFITTAITGLPSGAFSILFAAFDGTKLSLRVGASGTVAECTYSFQATLTGIYKVPTGAINLFNRSSNDFTFAGLGDEAGWIGGRTFTDAERLQMVQLAGV